MATVGEILKKTRIDKGIGLDEIEKKLKIREKFIRAIEENDWSIFSSKIYITGILKNYSRLLGLDSKKVLAFFRRDYEKKEEVRFKQRVNTSYLTSETKKAFRLLSLIIGIFFVVYFGYQISLYFALPKVEIVKPKKTSFTTEKKITIVGKTAKDTIVEVFSQRVYLDDLGGFEYVYFLKEGKNEIIFNLTGANGRKNSILKIYYKKSP